ncbi:MAG: ABC transporter transmembrane domain-containing protein, partial [Thermoguttaceae bacterium]
MLSVRSVTSPHRCREWPLDQITEFRLNDSIGSGFLQAKIGGRWTDLLRLAGRIGSGVSTVVDDLNSVAHRQDQSIDRPAAPEHASADFTDYCDSPADPRLQSKAARQVMAFVRPFWSSIALLFALSLGAVIIDVLPPMLQRMLVDDVLQVERPETGSQRLLFLLLAVVGGLLLLRLSATIVAVWKGWVSSRVGADMTAKLRTQLVEKLSQLPLAFYDRNQVGKLMSQVAYDTETLHTLVYHLT